MASNTSLQITGRGADDLQHLGGGDFLLERFAQLVEQPRVLDRYDGLGGEALDQLELLVGERPHLLAIDRDHTDHSIILEQRDTQDSPSASELGDRFLRVLRENVDHVGDLLGPRHATKGGRYRQWKDRILRSGLDKSRRRVVQGNSSIRIAFEQYHAAELGLANARCILQHGLENRLQLSRRAGDDAQHLRGRGLLLRGLGKELPRLGEFTGQLVELLLQVGCCGTATPRSIRRLAALGSCLVAASLFHRCAVRNSGGSPARGMMIERPDGIR